MKFLAAAAIMGLLLTGCVSNPATQSPENNADDSALTYLLQVLPGEYGNRLQAERNSHPHRFLDVQRRNVSGFSDAQPFLFTFRDPSDPAGEASRRSWYLLSSTVTGPSLEFVPDRGGQPGTPLPGCSIRLFPTADGQALAGQTDPGQCRSVGPGGQELGLLKEVRMGRGGIDIADKLQRSDGQVMHEETLRFQPRIRFTGWAGARPDHSSAADQPGNWRVSQPYVLDSEGGLVVLQDAAGDAMGLGLRLRRAAYPNSKSRILRLELLRISDDAGPQLLAYAFGDIDSTRLGLNLDWFQAGIERK